ncbi:PADC1-like protein [Mya arenaria]|uniref:PADC1-like protein n=1 Tax=Mya arenaria TaxID=6604 RepID=A0ABY7FIZ8_MYAAR|nr:PRADC1-like protein [Mya arenaria]WAR22153.1 PADC1-like protein [Mya arenaria]
MKPKISVKYLFTVLSLILDTLVSVVAEKKVLVTVPNIDVLLTDILFMEIIRPAEISYSYKIRPAKNFGVPFIQKYSMVDLIAAKPYHGCSPLTNAHFLSGKVVLLQRGECSFVTKTLNAEAAGALAVVIADNDISNDVSFVDMVDDNTEREVHIPSMFMLGKNGHIIKTTLERLGIQSAKINIPVNATGSPTHIVSQPPWTLW